MSSLRAVPVGTGKLQDNLGVDAAVERTTVGFPERRESSRCCMLPNATRLQRHPSPACSDPIGTAGQDLRLPPLPREESRQRLLLVDQRIDHWVFEFLVVHFLLRSRTAPSAMADGRPARGGGGRVYQHSVDRVEVYARGVERLFAMVHDGWVQREDLFSVPFLLRGMRAW